MSEQRPEDNPLDEYASQASKKLDNLAADVSNSSVSQVVSGQVSVRDSFVRSVHSSATLLKDVAVGTVHTASLEAQSSTAGVVLANSVRADRLDAAAVAAREIESQEIRTGLLFAVQVKGTVHSALSPLAAFAMGAGFAIVLTLLRLVPTVWRRSQAANSGPRSAGQD